MKIGDMVSQVEPREIILLEPDSHSQPVQVNAERDGSQPKCDSDGAAHFGSKPIALVITASSRPSPAGFKNLSTKNSASTTSLVKAAAGTSRRYSCEPGVVYVSGGNSVRATFPVMVMLLSAAIDVSGRVNSRNRTAPFFGAPG